MSLLPCCSQPTDGAKVNNNINEKLRQEWNIYRITHRLLLFGAGESGKSTIVKQMQIINMQGFSFEERKKFVPDIYRNIKDSLFSMLHAMNTISPKIHFETDEQLTIAERLLGTFDNNNNVEHHLLYTKEFFKDCHFLWCTSAIQSCYERSNEYQLIDCAKYFLDKIPSIEQDDFLPNDQDILRCRVLTTQIREIRFKVKDALFHMFDVGGQRNQRYKWIQCFNDATAIVFVVALSGYNLVLREDHTKNRLQESFDLFRQIWENRFLDEVSVILFLNKTDLLKEKVLSNRFKIEDYFPYYKNYQPIYSSAKERNSEPVEFSRAKLFFKDCFLTITKQSERSSPTRRWCYPHFTCALDTNHMRKIFEDCRFSIQKSHLDRFGINF